MAGTLPPVVALLTADTRDFTAKMAAAKGEMDDVSKTGSSNFSKLSSFGGAALAGIAGAGVAIAGVSVKMAADFQESMTQLVTGAGESQKNIKMVSDGILAMAGEVGQTPDQLAKGMFLIESAGYHGAAGLTVLKAAAEGAATGGAQMETVANAVTTALHDYALPASKANEVTSALVETVASGKTHLQDLASSLGKVMPVASALGLSLPQTTAAIATMTNAGLSARFAATHLQTTLLALSSPSSVASKSMAQVGLTAQQVKDTLDTQGLTGALQLIETHVGSTFPAGSVASVTAMKNLLGGTTGYSTALMLGGKNLATYEENVRNIGHSLDSGGKSVQGFSSVQKDLNFQLKQAEASAEAIGIKIGDWLIPKLEDLERFGLRTITWLEKNKDAAIALAAVIGGILTVAIGAFIVNKVASAITSLETLGSKFGLFGAGASQVETDSQQLGDSIGQGTTSIEDSLTAATTAFQSAADQITASLAQISEAFATTKEEIGGGLAIPTEVAPGAAGVSAEESGAAVGTEAGGEIGDAMVAAGEKVAASVADAMVAAGEKAAASIGTAEKAGGAAAAEEIAAGETEGGAAAGAEEGAGTAGGAALKGGALAAGGSSSLLSALAPAVAAVIGGQLVKSFVDSHTSKTNVWRENFDNAMSLNPVSQLKNTIPAYASAGAAVGHVIVDALPGGSALMSLLGGGGPAKPKESALQKDLAKDTSLVKQAALLQAMQKAGIDTASTAKAWLPKLGTEQSTKAIASSISKTETHLASLEAQQKKLSSEETVSKSQAQLKELRGVLATEKTMDASRSAIAATYTAIGQTNSHISDLKSVSGQITKDSTTLKSEQQLEAAIVKVNTDTTALRNELLAGLSITKLPDTRVTGTIKATVRFQ